jgi:cobalt-zinc-cadmium efflux system membrane fusion protein
MTPLSRSFPRAGSLLLCAAVACSGKSSPKAADTTAAGTTAAGPTPQNFTVTEDQRQRIHIVTVQPVSFRPSVDATGNVAFNGDKSTQVLSPVSGPATRVIGDVGMNVAHGQPLAYVSSPDFASAVANYRKAQTADRQARRVADRDSALFKNDALARADLEQAQADLSAADADVESAEQAMRALGVEDAQIAAVKAGQTAPIQAIIRSPIDGTIVEKLISNGQLLQAGSTPCFTVADLGTMWVLANVFANDLADVSVGAPADVFTDVTKAPIPGRVDYIASLADPGTKAVSVRIVAPNNDRALRKDMFVRVQIKSSHEHTGLLVPTSSVMRDDENLPFVFVAAGNAYARRRIDLGPRVGDTYQVTSGLAAGDKVVTEGALFLQFAESQ